MFNCRPATSLAYRFASWKEVPDNPKDHNDKVVAMGGKKISKNVTARNEIILNTKTYFQ
jgi:hypothetical protein